MSHLWICNKTLLWEALWGLNKITHINCSTNVTFHSLLRVGKTSSDSLEASIGQAEAEMPVLKPKVASQKAYMSSEYRIIWESFKKNKTKQRDINQSRSPWYSPSFPPATEDSVIFSCENAYLEYSFGFFHKLLHILHHLLMSTLGLKSTLGFTGQMPLVCFTDEETKSHKGLMTQLVRKYKFVNELSREHVCPGF